MDALVILIADPARPEHAVAAVSRLIAPRLPSGTRLLTVPALDVDLADDVAGSSSVVLVSVEGCVTAVETRGVEAAPHGEFGRALEPGNLLEIAYANYGVRPRMRLVAVPEGAEAAETAEDVIAQVLRLLGA